MALTEPPVYVSYAHKGDSPAIVDHLQESCRGCGIEVRRDIQQLKYGDSIRAYMDQLGAGGAIVVVLSEEYLKSKYCMYELLEIAKNKELRRRVYPIRIGGTPFEESEDRVPYLRHWEAKIQRLNAGISSLGRKDNLDGMDEDLKLYNEIRTAVAGLMKILADINGIVADVDRDTTDFQPVIERLQASWGRPSFAEAEPPPGTEVPSTRFDSVFRDKVRPILGSPAFNGVADGLLARAGGGYGDAEDAVALLCHPRLPLEDVIGWLTAGVEQQARRLRRNGGAGLAGFQQDAEELLGWLVLRAVDPAWLQRHAPDLGGSRETKVRLNLKHHSCVEVVLSRGDQRPAEFLWQHDSDRVVPKRGVGWGAEAGFGAPATWAEVIKAIWKAVIRRPFPPDYFGSEDHPRTLRAALLAQSRAGKPHYLTVPLDPLKARLSEQDLDALLRELAGIKLVLIDTGQGESALFLAPTLQRGSKSWALQRPGGVG